MISTVDDMVYEPPRLSQEVIAPLRLFSPTEDIVLPKHGAVIELIAPNNVDHT